MCEPWRRRQVRGVGHVPGAAPAGQNVQLTVGTEVQSYLLLGGHYIGSPEQIGPQSHVGHLARVLVHIEKIVEKTRFPVAVQIVGIPVARIVGKQINAVPVLQRDRKSTRLNSSHVAISYAVFCLKKKKVKDINATNIKVKR